MSIINSAYADAQQLAIMRGERRYFLGRPQENSGDQNGTFAQMLLNGLGEVNTLQQDADALSVQAIVDPESVDVHDVTIAAAKAELALNIAKNVMDRVVEAYQQIQNVR
jgi:flagellar hook-basal body complex protein FliE